MLFGEVGRCAAGTLADRSPPLVVYDPVQAGTPTVVWLFLSKGTVCFQPLRAEGTLALFLSSSHGRTGAIFMLRLNRKPMKYSLLPAAFFL